MRMCLQCLYIFVHYFHFHSREHDVQTFNPMNWRRKIKTRDGLAMQMKWPEMCSQHISKNSRWHPLEISVCVRLRTCFGRVGGMGCVHFNLFRFNITLFRSENCFPSLYFGCCCCFFVECLFCMTLSSFMYRSVSTRGCELWDELTQTHKHLRTN